MVAEKANLPLCMHHSNNNTCKICKVHTPTPKEHERSCKEYALSAQEQEQNMGRKAITFQL